MRRLYVLQTLLQPASVLLDENVDDNNNNWKVLSNSDYSVKIEDGLLHLQRYEKNKIDHGCIWYNKELSNFNTSTDFSITFYAKVLQSDDLFNMVDLQWGFRNPDRGDISTSDSLYQVDFVMDGQVRLNYFDKKKWTYLHRINSTDTTHSGDPTWRKDRNTRYVFPYKSNVFNKYEIIQNADSCLIKVNDVELINKPIHRIYGNSIGIQKCLKSSIVIDRIVVKQDTYY